MDRQLEGRIFTTNGHKYWHQKQQKKFGDISKVDKKNTRTTLMTRFWCFYRSLSTYFTPSYTVSIAASKCLLGTHLRPLSPSYRNQLINLKSKLTGFYIIITLVSMGGKNSSTEFVIHKTFKMTIFKSYSENTKLIKWINPKLLQ